MTTSPAMSAQGNTGCSEFSTQVLRVSRACLCTIMMSERGNHDRDVQKVRQATQATYLKKLQPFVFGMLHEGGDVVGCLCCSMNRLAHQRSPMTTTFAENCSCTVRAACTATDGSLMTDRCLQHQLAARSIHILLEYAHVQ